MISTLSLSLSLCLCLSLSLSHGYNKITNPCEIANVFKNYFASVADTAK